MQGNEVEQYRARRGRVEALGTSEAFLAFQERLARVARVERPVLVIGERGTGKELAVERLHYLSQRWQGPLVALNASALAETVLESELFGHEAGAFTGAARKRAGRFESADAGTLFLDEIGLIPVQVQEKILRVVEYGRFERVGGSEAVEVDVRIVGATNTDLLKLAAAGKFKRDLLDRLSFEVLFIPPLRERGEDILLLARHFAVRMSMELGLKEVPEFSAGAEKALEAYAWPGNVRELKNVVERAVYASEGRRITQIQFNPFEHRYARGLEESGGDAVGSAVDTAVGSGVDWAQTGMEAAVKRVELEGLRWALAQSNYHQGAAAERLGLTYHQFRGLYRKHRETLEA